jgi:hypothetical protein
MWGIGHTVSLLLAGTVMIILRPDLPGYLAPALELGVAVMILALGVNLLFRITRHGGATLLSKTALKA